MTLDHWFGSFDTIAPVPQNTTASQYTLPNDPIQTQGIKHNLFICGVQLLMEIQYSLFDLVPHQNCLI